MLQPQKNASWGIWLAMVSIPVFFLVLYKIFGVNFILDSIQSHWIFNNDNLRFVIPKLQVTQEAYRSWELPLWNPYEGCGQALVFGGSKMAWETLGLFFLPPLDVMIIAANLHIFLSFVFFFLCGRRLGFSPRAVFLGAIVWTLNGYHAWYINDHAVLGVNLWLPFLIYCFLRFQDSSRPLGWFCLASLGVGLQALYGRLPESSLTIAMAAAFMVVKTWQDGITSEDQLPKRSLAMTLAFIGGTVLLGTLLSAFFIVPNLGNLLASSRFDLGYLRTATSYRSFTSLLEFLFPNLRGLYLTDFWFIGVVSLPFVALAWGAPPRWLTSFSFIGLGLTLALSLPFRLWDLVRLLPPFAGMIVAYRCLPWAMFCLALLVCIGYDRALTIIPGSPEDQSVLRKRVKLLLFTLPLLGGGASLLGLIALNMVKPSFWPQILIMGSSVGALVFFYRSQEKRTCQNLAYFTLAGVLLFTLFLSNQANISDRDPKIVTKKYFATTAQLPVIKYLQDQKKTSLFRIFHYRQISRDFPFGERFGLQQLYSYGAFVDPRARYIHDQAMQEVGNLLQQSEAGPQQTPVPPRWLNLANIRYIIVEDEMGRISPTLGYPLVSQDKGILGISVYENPHALPRAYLASSYRVIKGDAETLAYLAQSDPGRLPGEVILGEEPGGEFAGGISSEGTISWIHYGFSRVSLRVSCAKPSILVLLDSYTRDWQVKVDGNPGRIIPANYLFRAVPLPPGNNLVEFVYMPRNLVLGVIISGAAVVFLLFFLVFGLLRKRKPNRAEFQV